MPESTLNVRFLATRPGRALHLICADNGAICGQDVNDPRARIVGPNNPGPLEADWAKYSAGGLCTKCATALDQLRLAARVAVRAETTARKAATK